MSEVKKNPIGAIVFCVFVLVLPVMTVYFSKSGLDKYKNLRSEMAFLKDSIRVSFDDKEVYGGALLDNEFIKGKLVLVAFWDEACFSNMTTVIDSMKRIQEQLSADDQKKLLFIIQTDGNPQDSTWNVFNYAQEWKVDTMLWKFHKGVDRGAFKMDQQDCFNIAMLDGRVSRKDESGDYKQGPLLCDYYQINKPEDIQAMLKHMAVIMPSKKRKTIEYKADEKLY